MSEEFQWPWQYQFPPFFTIQHHAKTLELQLSTWSELILKYHKHHKQSILNINDDSLILFTNETINRSLSLDDRKQILSYLEKNGNASPIDKQKNQWEIYWYPLIEWASIIYNWASTNGLSNTVCTIYELVSGDTSVGEEFHDLDNGVIIKALKLLEEQRKCELINFDENEGVKFF